MTPLNVDVPVELMERVQLAKVLTKTPIRLIATEAIDAWLRARGITPDKMPKLKQPDIGSSPPPPDAKGRKPR